MKRRVLPVVITQFAVLMLSACQGFMEVVTQAGDEGLTWPLPPMPSRLRYDAEVDLQQRLTGSAGIISGMSQSIFRPEPYRVAIARDLLAMVDRQQGAVYLTDRFQNSVTVMKYETGKEVTGVKDIAIDGAKQVYLLDSLKKQIAVFDHNGLFIRQFGANLMWTEPDRMAVDNIRQRLYVADRFQRRIYVFSLSGVFLYMFGEQGTATGQFSYLTDLTVDQQGNLYVLESMPLRIQQFGVQGNYMRSIKLDKDYFREPVAIAIESEQVFYIADSYRNEVAVLDMQGQTVLNIGGLGRRRGRFSELADLDFDPVWQKLITAEVNTARLQLLRRTDQAWKPYP